VEVAHYQFTHIVVEALIAEGFPSEDVERLVDRLFLGPNAGPDDLLSVVRNVLREKRARRISSRVPPAPLDLRRKS
jgi:hypothetical protein